jgi:hypothetical protein
MLNTAVVIFKAIGLAPVHYDGAIHKYCISSKGYLITLTHISILVYCNYSYWWTNDHMMEDPVESYTQNTISKIYTKSYWYLSIMMRMSYFLIVVALTQRYLELLNGLIAIKATWNMIGVDIQRKSRKCVASIFVALTLLLAGPFVGMAYQDAVLRFQDVLNWNTMIVCNCGGLYMPATTMNFLICVYCVKVEFDQICNLLRTRIQ